MLLFQSLEFVSMKARNVESSHRKENARIAPYMSMPISAAGLADSVEESSAMMVLVSASQ